MRARFVRSLPFLLSAATLLAAAISSTPALAQENPDVARGFSAEKLYQFGEVDAVNLFNGNLTLALPLGPGYSANGNLAYNLTLTYNSNVWRFEQRTWRKYGPDGNYELVTSKVALLDRTYNASPGWKVSLGELMDAVDPDNPGGRWAYLGEDGSHHAFYDTLHNYETPVSDRAFTRDGSYLRLRKLSGTEFEVDFPDGSTRSFRRDVNHWSSKFRPEWIEDAFGNRLTITQVSSLHWRFADAHRSHDLYFTNKTIDGTTWKVVDRAVLAAIGGGTATYQFHYWPKTIDESCYDDDDLDTLDDLDGVMTPAQRSIWVLADVTLPDSSTWAMPSYYGTCSEGSGADLSAAENQPGVLKTLKLPTLGAYEWTYRDYSFPTRVVGGSQGAGTLSAALSTGVRRKRMLNSSGGCFSFGQVGCEWTYTPSSNWAAFEHSTLVTYPSGDQSRFYFDVHWRGNPSTWDGWQYGLPFTTRASHEGRFLSQEIYAGAESPANLRRRVYVRYERDRINGSHVLPDQWENLNRRPASRKTFYADDASAWRSEDSSGFDGLGHYRNRTTNASWTGGASRTELTDFNAGNGAYNVDAVTNTVSGGYLGAPASWVLGTYSERSQTEGTDTARQYHCFDAATGALLRERVLRTSTRSTTDVVRWYERDGNGNVFRERHYGGDTGPISTTSDLCGMALSGDGYRRESAFQYGTLSSSRWLTGTGAHVLWTYQSTVDQATGLPKTVTGADGLTVTLTYDSSGRRTAEIPQSGAGARTTYTYNRATSASSPAEVLIRQHNNIGSVVLTQAKAVFDPFGRFWRDQRLEPSGSWSTVDTVVNSMGWTHSTSERQLGWPSKLTMYKNYDPFGRPGRIEPPDDPNGHKILLWYAGERQTTRAYTVCSSTAGCPSSAYETGYQVVETYDKHGRLHKVAEPSGAGGASVTTTYLYDVGNRLRQASTSNGTTQTRTFTYDKRGFLTSEQHPEKGASGNGTVSYLSYDALGNAGRKLDGPFDVRYAYDRAGRLAAVDELAGGSTRRVKTFTYAPWSSGSDLRGGKLWTADRYHYVVLNGNSFKVQARETYTYAGLGGAVSKRDTQLWVNDAPTDSFTQGFAWRDLGNLNYVDYPECTNAGCTAQSPRRVQHNFNTSHRGYLASVQDLTTGQWLATAFSYHPNGMYSQVTHGNGVADHQSLEASAMARPAALWTTGASSNWSSGTYRFDGAGNVAAIGTANYAYDGVSRLTRATTKTGQTGGGSTYTRAYTYDAFANLTNIQALSGPAGRSIPVSPANNRLTTAGYDSAGNVTSWNGTGFEYDAMGMVKKRIDSGGGEWLFFYTADDERLWSYHWTGSRWTLRDLDGKVLRDYRAGPSGWSVERDYVYADGKLLAAVKPSPNTTYHYHLDHLGTPRLITNQFGNQMAYHAYFPYGEEATYWGQDTETMKFTGHERDFYSSGPGDDLDYHHARYYNPLHGRYLTIDPLNRRTALDSPLRYNRYGYVAGNPLKFTDPNGKDLFIVYDYSQSGLTQNQRTALQIGVQEVFRAAGVDKVMSFDSEGSGEPKMMKASDRKVDVKVKDKAIAQGAFGIRSLDRVTVSTAKAPDGDSSTMNFLVNATSHEVGHATGALQKYSGDAAPVGSLMNPIENQAAPGTVMESPVSAEDLGDHVRSFSDEDAASLREVLNDGP